MPKHHTYNTSLTWTGNAGQGTQSYRSYERAYDIHIESKEIIQGSSDPTFMGDRTKHNPEELLLASIMLAQLDSIHHKANQYCFIANSVKFPIHNQATGKVL